jgi:hypothetical protein
VAATARAHMCDIISTSVHAKLRVSAVSESFLPPDVVARFV